MFQETGDFPGTYVIGSPANRKRAVISRYLKAEEMSVILRRYKKQNQPVTGPNLPICTNKTYLLLWNLTLKMKTSPFIHLWEMTQPNWEG